MPVLYATATLFVMQMLGEAFVRLTALPLPGPLAGLIFLFVVLFVRGEAPAWITETSSHVLQHLMLLFIPAIAGIMLYFDRIAQEWIPFLLACVLGVAITIVVTALTFRWMLRHSKVSEP
ncbi:MAG TPA: CidA/LrgA family protein [Eoetvoesiella sp.]